MACGLSDCSTEYASEGEDSVPNTSPWKHNVADSPKPSIAPCVPQETSRSNLWERRRKSHIAPLSCQRGQNFKMKLEHEPEICGRYEVKNIVGSGYMSIVYRASLRGNAEKEVALKVLKECQDPAAVRSAHQEFKILKRLPLNPHIIQVLESHELQSHGPALVFEFFDGPTLQELVTSSELRRLSVSSVSIIGLALFEAVAHLHVNLVVHRDIKPRNIFASRSLDDVRLADFNVAKHFEDGESCTPVGDFLYRAPEVLSGTPQSESSDVWASGLSVFFALFGESPPYRKLVSHKSNIDALNLQGSSLEIMPNAFETSLRGALSRHPLSRPSAGELATQSAWF